MNKTLRRLFVDIRMSLLFLILGAVVIYLAGSPIASMLVSQWDMIVVKGAPDYTTDYSSNLSKLVMQQTDTDNVSDVIVPTLGEQYGDMTCDRIALTAPIYYGDEDASFRMGVGHYTGSGLPGEGRPILIGGHDVTFFAPLEQIQVGDQINITTSYGLFEYQVTGTQIVDHSDTTAYDLTGEKEQLILYTCYPFGQIIGDRSGRFFVYCDRIEEITAAVK